MFVAFSPLLSFHYDQTKLFALAELNFVATNLQLFRRIIGNIKCRHKLPSGSNNNHGSDSCCRWADQQNLLLFSVPGNKTFTNPGHRKRWSRYLQAHLFYGQKAWRNPFQATLTGNLLVLVLVLVLVALIVSMVDGF